MSKPKDTVEVFNVKKSFALGIKSVHHPWYWDGKFWRRLTKAMQDSDWYEEEYTYHNCNTSDILSNWMEQLEGVVGWGDYGDFTVEFRMEDVGLSEATLVGLLQKMANKVNRCSRLEAYDTPPRIGTRYPAMVPVDGAPGRDYPVGLVPTGAKRI